MFRLEYFGLVLLPVFCKRVPGQDIPWYGNVRASANSEIKNSCINFTFQKGQNRGILLVYSVRCFTILKVDLQRF